MHNVFAGQPGFIHSYSIIPIGNVKGLLLGILRLVCFIFAEKEVQKLWLRAKVVELLL